MHEFLSVREKMSLSLLCFSSLVYLNVNYICVGCWHCEESFPFFWLFYCVLMYLVFLVSVCKWERSSVRVVFFSASFFLLPLFSTHQNEKMKDHSVSPPLPLDLFRSPLSVLWLRQRIDWLVVSAVNTERNKECIRGRGSSGCRPTLTALLAHITGFFLIGTNWFLLCLSSCFILIPSVGLGCQLFPSSFAVDANTCAAF